MAQVKKGFKSLFKKKSKSPESEEHAAPSAEPAPYLATTEAPPPESGPPAATAPAVEDSQSSQVNQDAVEPTAAEGPAASQTLATDNPTAAPTDVPTTSSADVPTTTSTDATTDPPTDAPTEAAKEDPAALAAEDTTANHVDNPAPAPAPAPATETNGVSTTADTTEAPPATENTSSPVEPVRTITAEETKQEGIVTDVDASKSSSSVPVMSATSGPLEDVPGFVQR